MIDDIEKNTDEESELETNNSDIIDISDSGIKNIDLYNDLQIVENTNKDTDSKYIIKKIVASFPLQPGVYLMKDKNSNIIYVGKAKWLRKRVGSYFTNLASHTKKERKLIKKICSIDYIVTASELEALVLECSLIKLHQPTYNILLKDDKGYNFIRISSPPFSKISVVKQKINDDSTYIGPYTSSFTASQIVETVNKIFKLSTCKRDLTEANKYTRPCLNYHINLCSGPCAKRISEDEYQQNINNAIKYLKSGFKETIKDLKEKMEIASSKLRFEDAAVIRDQIISINKVNYSQKVAFCKFKEADVLAIVENNGLICCTFLIFRNYKLVDKRQFIFDTQEEISTIRKMIILQYYSGEEVYIPSNIYVDNYPEDFDLITKFLVDISKNKHIKISIPNRGASLKLIEMAVSNSQEKIAQEFRLMDNDIEVIKKVKEILNLKVVPKYIEAFDISNIGSQTIVGGMVVFENGKPKKGNYRRFKIKNSTVQDDYGSISEMLTRRLENYNNPNKDSFKILPDLIFIDGGFSHVSIVKRILEEYDIDIPIFGMVKDDFHQTRALISSNGEEINIKNDQRVYLFIKKIQDEVHRYTITYSRTSHNKKSISSILTSIAGIGNTRANSLFEHFLSLDKIKNASVEELAQVKGISKFNAQSIYEYFRGNKK